MVVANGAEGEPGSFKDRVLMCQRPHLVVDGAILAAEAIGADEIVFYVGRNTPPPRKRSPGPSRSEGPSSRRSPAC